MLALVTFESESDDITESTLCLPAVFCGLIFLLQLPVIPPLLSRALALLVGRRGLTSPHFMVQGGLEFKEGFFYTGSISHI